jgi:hypothetical protein
MTVWCFGPRHTPVEALDLGTGYEIAAAALRGLTKRLRNGAGPPSRCLWPGPPY